MFSYGQDPLSMLTSSLATGGLGGYGLGNYGFPGMTGGCTPFVNCDGEQNIWAMAGFGIGQNLIRMGIGAVAAGRTKKKTDAAENKENSIKNLNKQIDTKLEALGLSDEADLQSVKPDDKFQKAIDDAETDLKDANKEYNDATTKIDTLTTEIDTLTTDISTLEKQLKTEQDKDTIKNLESKIETKKEALKVKEAEKKELEEKTGTSGSKATLTKAKEDAEEALETAKENYNKEEKKINKKVAEIEKLIEKRDNLIEKTDEQYLDKADGSKRQRTKEKDYNNKFTTPANGKKTLAANAEVSKKDIRFAILRYRSASENEKDAVREEFNLLWEALPAEDRNDSSLKKAHMIINRE